MSRSYSISLTQFFILAALVRCPMHAYALRQEIIELSQRQVWPAYSTIQYALAKLHKRGFVEDRADDPYYCLKAERGLVYQLTPLGQKEIWKLLSMQLHVLQIVRFWMQRGQAFETPHEKGRRFINTPLAHFTLPENYTEFG